VATQEHFTVLVQPFARDRFEAQMHGETITTESSHGRMGSVGRTPTECHYELSTCVQALQSLDLYV
jgi:hypothetical protein